MPTWAAWLLGAMVCGMLVCVFVGAWLDGAFDLVIEALRQRRRAKTDPAWLHTPYAGPNACYGCGLEPEVMNPGQWILCRWCNELRAILMSRAL